MRCQSMTLRSFHGFTFMEQDNTQRKRDGENRKNNEHRHKRIRETKALLAAFIRDETGHTVEAETITSTSTSSKDLWQFVPNPDADFPLIPLGSLSADNATKIKRAVEAREVSVIWKSKRSKEPCVTMLVPLSAVESSNIGRVQAEENKRLAAENARLKEEVERLREEVNTLRGANELLKEKVKEIIKTIPL
ncbi:hypothetical protein BDZ91DRAFT_725803 [Kalaharituber pfeilii]|nr:hypothetical protein BDZ91DRAFT_725803 [Kalaharituber pfeilii]